MTTPRFIFFLVLFTLFAVGDVLWWWWATRRVRTLRHGRLWQALLTAWVAWLVGYLLLAFVYPHVIRRSQSPVPTPLHAAVYLWHLLVLPVLGVGIPSVWLLRSVGKLIGRVRSRVSKSPAPAEERAIGVPVPPSVPALGLTRRQLLGATAVAVPPLITGGLVLRASQQLHDRPRVRRFEIALPQVPPDMDGMTIAHVTDMHVGKFTRARTLPRLADQVNGLRADFVAVTGDLIDMSLSDLPAALDFLDRLDPGNGLIVCEGNHDLMDSPNAFEGKVRRSGHPLLLDEDLVTTFRGHPLQFLGIRWDHGDRGIGPSMGRVAPLLRPDALPILLAHHPHAFDAADQLGIPLTLAGHTHGGQLMLTEHLGAGSVMFRYWSGLYRKPASALVVSNGVGAWFPLRINAPAEIVHITLRSTVA